jgi:hypothetical protein
MKIVKAELLPLEGKYYYSEILVTFTDKSTILLKVINSDELAYIPSIRECALVNITQEQWINNVQLYDEESDSIISAKDRLEINDMHYEDQKTYESCLEIINKLTTNIMYEEGKKIIKNSMYGILGNK